MVAATHPLKISRCSVLNKAFRLKNLPHSLEIVKAAAVKQEELHHTSSSHTLALEAQAPLTMEVQAPLTMEVQDLLNMEASSHHILMAVRVRALQACMGIKALELGLVLVLVLVLLVLLVAQE